MIESRATAGTEKAATKPGDDHHEVRTTDALFGAVYQRLKAMAGRQLARGRSHSTLDTTALVHELYLRVNSNGELVFSHDAQFFAYAAQAMRHLLADRARDRLRLRAGGEWVRVTLTGTDHSLAIDSAEQALALDAALGLLEQTDERAARVVELRYFAGLTLEQIADAFDMNRRTVDRDWRFAKAFLKTEIE
jgi:RNA polymerase sigma factor (TIGR02999 family)